MNHRLSLSPQALSDTLSTIALRSNENPNERTALFQAASAAKAKADRQASPIAELPATATLQEVNRERRLRAVRRGKEVFLPHWRELTTAMPNLLLRSSLWSVRAIKRDQQVLDMLPEQGAVDFDCTEGMVDTLSDTVLINRGPGLGSYDRRVFAACLDYYRSDQPLSSGGDSPWLEVSFFKFIQGLGSSYHADGHRALRASLERLAAMSLHVRHGGVEVHLPRILEVSFADGEARGEKPVSSDRIQLRVLGKFAQLYGSSKWTAVEHDVLDAGLGLKSWLGCFYSTHSKPFTTKLDALHKLTGSSASFSKFKQQLKIALDAMKAADQPTAVRIRSYIMDTKTLWVDMAAWSEVPPGERGDTSEA